MRPPSDASRLVISNIRMVTAAEVWQAFLADEGYTVPSGWGTGDITTRADRWKARTVTARRAFTRVLHDRLGAAMHEPGRPSP